MGLEVLVITGPIEVILPTFNGACFLREQIDSIARQTLRPCRLLLRDDGSSDGTQELIQQLAHQYGSWIEVLPSQRNLGCTGNVNELLEATSAPYVALADQDDVWLPNKLEIAYRDLCSVELARGSGSPVLVHTDLRLVDERLQDLGETYMQKQLIKPALDSPSELALTNVVTGCTVLCNRSLLDRALPLPAEALVHDWWLALVASLFGCIRFHPSCAILYRQHSANSIGAKGLGWHYWLQRLHQWLLHPATGGHTLRAIRQIECLELRYSVCVSPLPRLIRLSRLRRAGWFFKTPIAQWPYKHGVLRSIAFYFQLFCF